MSRQDLPDEERKMVDRAGDDFRIIRGIGPSIDSWLHERGVLTYAQLAAMTPADIATLLGSQPLISEERIAKQEWPEQAQRLASKASEGSTEGSFVESRQRYATFVVELLLDDNDNVRRTRLVHSQSGEDVSWAGWDERHLIGAIAENAGTKTLAPEHDTGSLRPNLPSPLVEAGPPRVDTEGIAQLEMEMGAPRIGFVSNNGSQAAGHPEPAMYAELDFSLRADGLYLANTSRVPCIVHFLAFDTAHQAVTVLASSQQLLDLMATNYTNEAQFELPNPGTYQIVAAVIVRDAEVVGVSLGPLLEVA
ncbi:MAG: hypothetical protein U0822_22330 [Anaerolineae bacterium]